MTKQSVRFLAVLALLGFAIPSQVHAQVIYVSGGATFPTGDFGDYANTGWMAAGGVLFGVGDSGLGVGGELFYGQNNHSVEGVDLNSKTSPYGAMAIVDYSFGNGGIDPYVFGGAGVMVHRYSAEGFDSESETKFGYQFGAGIGFPIGETTEIYAEGRYMGATDTQYFGLLGGFAFGIGN
ncbi:MAG: acyloxyacyl hydrolase [Candidatus Palauibacterales bacterium]|nr:acyloxyacyl hydrolase [Candidatus Palauibacterales bacterium]MDP2483700.1 acyloxyacyl hydrolase [Candidatus Palauibacterales bacterium]